MKSYDAGYRIPPSAYWKGFPEAHFVMEPERKELSRLAADGAATARLVKVRNFKVTGQIQSAYEAETESYESGGPDGFCGQGRGQVQ